MLTISDSAARKIRDMAVQHQVDHSGVRVMVVGGGCSGLAYLEGTTIDFVETFSYAGFQFDNPNAQKGCGCGKSFTV